MLFFENFYPAVRNFVWEEEIATIFMCTSHIIRMKGITPFPLPQVVVVKSILFHIDHQIPLLNWWGRIE